jgi:hypothetical protein
MRTLSQPNYDKMSRALPALVKGPQVLALIIVHDFISTQIIGLQSANPCPIKVNRKPNPQQGAIEAS